MWSDNGGGNRLRGEGNRGRERNEPSTSNNCPVARASAHPPFAENVGMFDHLVELRGSVAAAAATVTTYSITTYRCALPAARILCSNILTWDVSYRRRQRTQHARLGTLRFAHPSRGDARKGVRCISFLTFREPAAQRY